MTNTSWTFVGEHPEELADGRTVAPGNPPMTLNPEEPHNMAMIERGVLIPSSEAAASVAEEIKEESSSTASATNGRVRKNTNGEGSK